jgi:pilus assembly protein Flp/PilA
MTRGVSMGDLIMKNWAERFAQDESGATAIEYGLIAALVAVGIIISARALGLQISTTLTKVRTEMAKTN